jgi:Flp pilus assembly protein TadD
VTSRIRRAARGCAAALLLPLLALAAALGGCAPLPQIVVLEDPLTADEHVALGVAYERRRELGPAAREYEKALRKDRTSFRARLNLGNVRLSEKRYQAARTEYLRALELHPADAEATNNLAWVAILSGDGREEALRRLEALVAARDATSPQADGLTPVLLDTRGVLLGRLGRRAEADVAFAQAEAACLALGGSSGADASGAARCPETVLEEIRRHREELR